MKKKILAVASALIFVLTACGAPSTPQLGVLDMQNTALAASWTQIAMTQAAMPSPTPIPPTFTPEPTSTIAALTFPTADPLLQPVAPAFPAVPQGSPTPDCTLPLIPGSEKGTRTQVKFVNESKGSVNLSFGMYTANELGECGTYTFSFGSFESPVVSVLTGCYWAYAWVTGNKPSTAKSTNAICISAPNPVIGITVTSEWIGID